MSAPFRIFIAAVEPSGDALAAEVVTALRDMDPSVIIAGTGGDAMRAAGVPSAISIDGLAILGLTEAFAARKRVDQAVKATVAAAVDFKPDMMVLVDSWGFTIRAAQAMRKAAPGVKLVKLVGPQVWATRPGRAKTIARDYDALLALHDFELPFYEGLGLPVTVIGNPAVSRGEPGDAAGFRARHGLQNRRIVLMLPGSRSSEIKRVAPVLEAAAAILAASRPDVTVISVLAPAVADAVRERSEAWAFEHLLVGEDEKASAFAAATVALACSGTVTTEVAMQGTPMVVGYAAGALTYFLASRFLLTTRFVTLLNVAMDEEIVPEFLQHGFMPATVAVSAAALLDDPLARAAQVARQNEALVRLGRGGPNVAQRAARAILAMLAAHA